MAPSTLLFFLESLPPVSKLHQDKAPETPQSADPQRDLFHHLEPPPDPRHVLSLGLRHGLHHGLQLLPLQPPGSRHQSEMMTACQSFLPRLRRSLASVWLALTPARPSPSMASPRSGWTSPPGRSHPSLGLRRRSLTSRRGNIRQFTPAVKYQKWIHLEKERGQGGFPEKRGETLRLRGVGHQ